ncbi:zinc finger Ran-binding domain-containing protein 2-like [Oppia nitens]|uniref:zinc finger Ran-binding domain-containing protein 2-like n=1 Tax=Oppia nitens TaxID=1686743 RepID=UPI0023DB5D6D|nr:zinc finger Ran-binding domain-containing protein 2-like [Oppia nitens]
MSTKSQSGPSFRMSEGDWICDDENCQNVNFARRMNCNICGKDKPMDERLKDKEDAKRKIGHEIGKAAAEKSKGLFSADDWQCGRCGNVNWARRHTCNMCSAPKFSDNEERTGLGGGYNERDQHIEYKEREDSDDEYDDFGRKKKKFRKGDNGKDDNNISDNNRKDKREDKDDEEEEDKADVSKYKLNSDEEKEEEEDVSKYKLNSDDDDEDEEEGDVSKYKLNSDDDDEDDEEGDVSKYKLDSDEDDDEDDDDEDLSKYDLSDCVNNKK